MICTTEDDGRIDKKGRDGKVEQYSLRMPGNVHCGEGAMEHMGSILQGHRKAAVFTDKGIEASGVLDYPLEQIRKAGADSVILDDLPAEPTYGQAQQVIDRFRESGADLIVAVGGGSVMDAAKLASIMGADLTVGDLLENPLLGKKEVESLMIPTTAGTGAEATPNSIVAVPEKELKVGIVNPEMIADHVILDGRMIKKLPASIAAATGVDALCHAVECFTSNKANPFSDLFALEAARLIFENIETACLDQNAMEAKNHMLRAAFYAGVAITASGTTAVHALSYPLGGKYHIAHGVSNAILLLPVMRFNQDACLAELSRIYDAVWARGDRRESSAEEKAEAVLRRMEEILRTLRIPTSLTGFGVDSQDLDTLVDAGMQVTRLLVNNKKTVTPEDARKIYRQVL